MKKLVSLMAAAVIATGASAQTVQYSKTLDNIYVGVNGGLATKTTGHAWMKGLDPNFGVRVGRWFTPGLGSGR
jgi:OOP family OmpA-OmpF porin